ncbi:7996_t:CDS:2 [Paraglomus occultum]|uniref:7996_t:CDS:1 n=1 Tax=Paraglomus occultum TaxID=144539 RepID=A0A9N9F2V1_9GLOM|nr:7996_t:CDS:2 [Paraglomus occultum]
MDTYCVYFKETTPDNYRFLDFYQYRSKQEDFTFSFQKEADKLRKDLDLILKNGPEENKKGAIRLKQSFKYGRLPVVPRRGKTHTTTVGTCLLLTLWSACPLWSAVRQYGRLPVVPRRGKTHTTTNHRENHDVRMFWNKIENELAIRSKRQELRLTEIDAARSVMQNTATVLETAIGRVDTTLSDATYYTPTPVPCNLLSRLSEEKGLPSYYEIPAHWQPEPNPFISYSQDRKHDREPEEEDDTEEEYNADQTIIGGGNVSWIVNGLDIRKKLTEYQLERNLPKSKPEYYDVIFFHAKDKNSFLETLEKDTVQQMLKDISEEEKEMQNEQEIKSLLSKIIVRDMNKVKNTVQQYKNCNNSFERGFTLNFVDHMIKLIEGTNLLLEPLSEGTYIVSVLGPILDQIFIKHKEDWRTKYGETCLKANAKECNAQKEDDNRRSPGKKIDVIITLKEEDEEFSVVFVYNGGSIENSLSEVMERYEGFI